MPVISFHMIYGTGSEDSPVAHMQQLSLCTALRKYRRRDFSPILALAEGRGRLYTIQASRNCNWFPWEG